MRRVLLTGGAGFIGFHLSQRLSENGWDVVILDSLEAQVHRNVDESRARIAGRLIEGDVRDGTVWEMLPAVDAVVHLAAETGVGQSMYETERYRSVNVDGTANALAFASKLNAPLVFFSSRAVYGEGHWRCDVHGDQIGSRCCDNAEPVASLEDDAFAPVSVYGETKVVGEGLLSELNTPVTIIRPQNVIGSGQALHNPYTGVLAAFLSRLKEGRPIQIYGDGLQTRDFVHVSDVTRLVSTVLDAPPSGEEPLIVNCGTGVRTSLLELARYAIDAAPVDVALEHVDVTRAGDIEHACADMSRCVALGLEKPRMNARDAVSDFIESGWNEPGVTSAIWDEALAELEGKGLTS